MADKEVWGCCLFPVGAPKGADCEADEMNWSCLSSFWQHLLNKKLASFHSSMHLALATYKEKLNRLGASNRQTQYAWGKYMNSCKHLPPKEAVILFNKFSGKILPEDRVKQLTDIVDSEVKVSLPKNIYGYTLDIVKMTLTVFISDARSLQCQIVTY